MKDTRETCPTRDTHRTIMSLCLDNEKRDRIAHTDLNIHALSLQRQQVHTRDHGKEGYMREGSGASGGTQTHMRWHWRLRCGPPSLPPRTHAPPPLPPAEPPPHASSRRRAGPRSSPRRATLTLAHMRRPSARSPALAKGRPSARRPSRHQAARSAAQSAASRQEVGGAVGGAVGGTVGGAVGGRSAARWWCGGDDDGDGVAAAAVARRWR